MDSLSRKRKLADFGNKVTPLRKSITGGEGLIGLEKAELNSNNHYYGLQCEAGNAARLSREVLQEKSYRRLTTVAELCEKDEGFWGRAESSRTFRERSIFNEVKNDEDFEDDDEETEEQEEEEKNDVDIDDGGCGNDDDEDDNNEDDDDYGDGDDDGDDDEDEDEDENNQTSGRHEKRTENAVTREGGDRREILWFSTDYIENIISHEMHKESLYRLSVNFCRKYEVNPTGREILIDWLISVQVHFKAENSTLHLAVAFLDTMLDSVHIPINELQAAAVAAFWVAYKYVHGSLSMKTLLNLCAGSVTKEMIESNEILVVQTSRLMQAGGSLAVFFNYFLYKIFGFKFPPEIYYCGLYFIEIMLLQFIFVDCHAHEKAITAVFTALAVFGCSDRFDLIDVSNFITKRKLQHVYRRLMRSLRLMYNDTDSLKNSNVYRKYKSSRYFKISIHHYLKCLASA